MCSSPFPLCASCQVKDEGIPGGRVTHRLLQAPLFTQGVSCGGLGVLRAVGVYWTDSFCPPLPLGVQWGQRKALATVVGISVHVGG